MVIDNPIEGKRQVVVRGAFTVFIFVPKDFNGNDGRSFSNAV